MRRLMLAGLAGLATGYFFDPESGARRRNTTRDRVTAFFRRGAREAERRARYAEGVAHGVAHKAQTATEKVTGGAERSYDDATLRAKVESEIFRAPDAPKDKVSVNTANGIVYLRGQLEHQEEIESLVAAARKVEGVQDVRNLLHQPGAPAPGA